MGTREHTISVKLKKRDAPVKCSSMPFQIQNDEVCGKV